MNKNTTTHLLANSTWDYRTANIKQYTHCYHNYPAMMIPQIATRLITMYGQNAGMLFDPYCGTGTSLVEANLRNINAIGTDLNPLARLIARTKTAKIELQILDLYLKQFNDFGFALNFGQHDFNNVMMPTFKNIDFWFSEKVKGKLAVIREFIANIVDINTRQFFYVAFSEVVRESSFTRNSEFKLYRMPEKKRASFDPDLFAMMMSKLARNRKGLIAYLDQTRENSATTTVLDFNSVNVTDAVKNESVDIIVTSPPYGDSKTTVAYGQFSRLSNQWLGIENAGQVDNNLMGGKRKEINDIGVNVADNAIAQVAQVDEKRAKEVYSFYQDYSQSIQNVSKTLKSGGYACYVVGNRRVKGITLPTDEITQRFFEVNGFQHINTFIRNIPHKRMPSRNSPTNESGKTATTMNHEYIVVMQKS